MSEVFFNNQQESNDTTKFATVTKFNNAAPVSTPSLTNLCNNIWPCSPHLNDTAILCLAFGSWDHNIIEPHTNKKLNYSRLFYKFIKTFVMLFYNIILIFTGCDEYGRKVL